MAISSITSITASLAPPCSGPFQRADRCGDRAVHVGQRGGDDAGGEHGRVEAVLGVKNQRGLERRDDLGLGRAGHARPGFGRRAAPGGQLAVPEQVGNFLEAAPASQFLDRVATVGQRVGFGVDHRDGHGSDYQIK